MQLLDSSTLFNRVDTLLNYEQGKRLKFENNTLIVKEGPQTRNSNRDNKRVREVVSQVFQEITRTNFDHLDDTQRSKLQSLKDKISLFDTRVFDRQYIGDNLQDLWSKEVAQKRAALNILKAQGEPADWQGRDALKKAEFDLRVAEVKFAQSMGVEFRSVSEGANGTYFGRNIRGKSVLVFKPADEEQGSAHSPKFSTRIKEWFKRNIPFFNSAQNEHAGQGYKKECASSHLDTLLNLNIVPITYETEFESSVFQGQRAAKTGSCQLFKESAGSADKFFGLPHRVPVWFQRVLIWVRSLFRMPTLDLVQYQKLAILTAINGDVDTHGGNWLVGDVQRVNGRRHAGKIIKIDNGSSFYSTHADQYLMRRHNFAFRMFPEGKKAFGTEALRTIEFVKANRQLIIDEMSKQLGDIFEQPSVNGSTVKSCLQDRLDVLTHLVGDKQAIKTVYQLSKFKQTKHFEKAKTWIAESAKWNTQADGSIQFINGLGRKSKRANGVQTQASIDDLRHKPCNTVPVPPVQ